MLSGTVNKAGVIRIAVTVRIAGEVSVVGAGHGPLGWFEATRTC